LTPGSTYKRALLMFLVVIIPVYISILYIYLTGIRLINEELEKSMTSKASFYAQSISEEMSRIHYQLLQTFNSTDFQKLGMIQQFPTKYVQLETLYRVKEYLSAVLYSSEFLVDAGVYIKELQHVISFKDAYGVFTEEQFNTLLENITTNADQGVLFDENEQLYMYAVNPNSYLKDYVSYIAYVEISKDRIYNTMKKFNDDLSSQAVLMDLEGRWSLTFPEDPENGQALLSFIQGNMQEGVPIRKNIEGTEQWLVIHKIEPLNAKLILLVPWKNQISALRLYLVLFIIFTVVSMLFFLYYTLYLRRIIHRPIRDLVDTFSKIEKGKLDLSPRIEDSIEFQYMYKNLQRMLDRLKTGIKQVYEQQIHSQQSELRHLQSQINPHFLYNSFFNISRMAKSKDIESIYSFSRKLASYYRYITRVDNDIIQMEEEVQHAKNYAEIQKIRFGERIRVFFPDLPAEMRGVHIPKLILQPIVENAYEHGLADVLEEGLIQVSFAKNEAFIEIAIEDNGAGLSPDQLSLLTEKLAKDSFTSEKTGILNVNRRLKILCGDSSGLVVSPSLLGGLCTTVRIQYVHLQRLIDQKK